MAEHFRASEGAGPAEPMGPDGTMPVPEAPTPEAGAPSPDPAVARAVPPAQTPSPAGVPTDGGSAATPPFLQVPTPSQPAAPAPKPVVPEPQPQQLSPSASIQMPAQPAPTPAVSPAQTAQSVPLQVPTPAQTGAMPVQAQAQAQAQVRDLGYEPHGMYASLGQETERPQVNRNLEPTISMRHVTKIYPAQPNKPALEDVSLDIYPGEFVFIVGHSGSGKSTFLRLLTRELMVTSGDIMVAGQSLAKMRNWKVPFLRRQIGCVFQDFKLLQDRTTYENVAFTLECIGKPKSVIKAQVPEVLRLVGLADKMDMFPDQLSGGEQQRVSVARAMVNRPPLLICDEPTGNLDPAISLGIMKLLDAINRNGTTVIMATHDREMVDSMRKRVVALENGHLVRDQERGGYGFYGSL